MIVAIVIASALKMANTWEKFVILRAGKLRGVKGPGLFLIIPVIDHVVAVIDELMRADMVEQTWRIVQPVLDAWAKKSAVDLPIYPAGSPGPTEADALLARGGRGWRSLHGDDGGRSS